MAVSDWYTTASLNVTVDGININTGCAPGNVDNALRAIMANVRVMYNALPDTSTFVKKDGTTDFTGQPKFTGRGAFRHNNDSTLIDGRDYHQLEGSALPATPAEGMRVWFYS